MTKRVDLTSHATLVGQSFSARVDMLEHVIGSTHFPSIGQYKERLLAKVLRDYLPRTIEVGTGFVLFPCPLEKGVDLENFDELNQASFQPSRQCDIIVFDSSTVPVIFRDDDFVVVRPESVKAIIEVKGSLTSKGLRDTLENAIEFGQKWRQTQQFYRDHHQEQANRPGLFLMAWQVKTNRTGHRQITPSRTREIIASTYRNHLLADEADAFPLLEKVLVYDDFEITNCCYMSENPSETGFEYAEGWASDEGRYLRSVSNKDKFEWQGDKTIATLLASLHYQLNRSGFNRFFSYTDEIRHLPNISSPKIGFSPTWIDLPSEQFRRINSDRLIEDSDNS
ncbi:DUF6602 domain-containing protein [Hoeflea sp. TYP-13]|uniref:DUF6602 domain-containing protein n=1 Tax=Hoeflea sp. TYP-13 TaxID=3230023 RepID=UPI0034C6C9F6